MTVTDDQLRAIAYLAVACRPTGCKPWDADGVYKNLAKVRDRSLAALTIAAVQAAEDRNANTPGVIPAAGPHWRAPDTAPVPRQEVDAELHCSSCGRPEDACRLRRLPGDLHTFVPVAQARGQRRPPEAARQIAAELRARIRPMGDRPDPEETTHA